MTNEDRLIEIEIKLSRQEDMVDSLNQVIYQQQKQIDHLQAICATLAKHIQQAADIGRDSNQGNEKPPHY